MPRGRPYFRENLNGSKEVASSSLPLDVRMLHKNGYLSPGMQFSMRWWRGTDKSRASSIGGVSYGDYVILAYAYQGETVEQRVQIERTPCNYGGSRPWWCCSACLRRVAVLYGAGKYFACRHCYGLCYGSQKENPNYRALRRAFKIRERLGDDGGIHRPFPPKPKWMRHHTYRVLKWKGQSAEHESWGVARRLCGMD